MAHRDDPGGAVGDDERDVAAADRNPQGLTRQQSVVDLSQEDRVLVDLTGGDLLDGSEIVPGLRAKNSDIARI